MSTPALATPPGERSMGRWARRAFTIPAYLLAFALAAALSPVLLPLSLALDLLRRRRLATARFLCVVLVYLGFEVAGLAILGWLFLRRGPARARARHQERLFRLELGWASALLQVVLRIFGMRLEVEGLEAAAPGPILLLANHVSVADVLLPAALVSGRLGLRLRYVAKLELLWDPCVDFAGHWLPNVFVRRGSADTPGDVARVQSLLRDLGAGDGVFLFPEGTRATPGKRARLLARREADGPAGLAESARRLRALMPPRLGGVLGLLERNPGADVVFLAHVGFEGARRLADVWSGALVGRIVRVALWRRSWAEVPADSQGRLDWLLREWEQLDAWVASQRAGAEGPPLEEGRPAPRAQSV